MAREVVWTLRAQKERTKILHFWINHNNSNSYSIALNNLLKEAVRLIKRHPKIGRPTDIDNVRVKIVRDYLMFYELTENKIYILSVWDNRQNPESLDLE